MSSQLNNIYNMKTKDLLAGPKPITIEQYIKRQQKKINIPVPPKKESKVSIIDAPKKESKVALHLKGGKITNNSEEINGLKLETTKHKEAIIKNQIVPLKEEETTEELQRITVEQYLKRHEKKITNIDLPKKESKITIINPPMKESKVALHLKGEKIRKNSEEINGLKLETTKHTETISKNQIVPLRKEKTTEELQRITVQQNLKMQQKKITNIDLPKQESKLTIIDPPKKESKIINAPKKESKVTIGHPPKKESKVTTIDQPKKESKVTIINAPKKESKVTIGHPPKKESKVTTIDQPKKESKLVLRIKGGKIIQNSEEKNGLRLETSRHNEAINKQRIMPLTKEKTTQELEPISTVEQYLRRQQKKVTNIDLPKKESKVTIINPRKKESKAVPGLKCGKITKNLEEINGLRLETTKHKEVIIKKRIVRKEQTTQELKPITVEQYLRGQQKKVTIIDTPLKEFKNPPKKEPKIVLRLKGGKIINNLEEKNSLRLDTIKHNDAIIKKRRKEKTTAKLDQETKKHIDLMFAKCFENCELAIALLSKSKLNVL